MLLLQIMMVIIAYLIIMFRKYRKLKKKLEFLKGQEEAQDLLNSFLLNSSNKWFIFFFFPQFYGHKLKY